MLSKLAVFDMDETLISSDFIWPRATISFLNDRAVEINVDMETLFYEKGFSFIIALLLEHFPEHDEFGIMNALVSYAEAGYKNDVYVKEGAYELIEKVRSLGYVPVILTANNPVLSSIIEDRFKFPVDCWFSTRTLGIGKNDSHVYDLIASSFGVSAENIVLFDDSEYALETAYYAGLKAIRIYSRKESGKAKVPFPTLRELNDFKKDML